VSLHQQRTLTRRRSLITSAGFVLPATLAQRLGLPERFGTVEARS
jgi:hypothetical protein